MKKIFTLLTAILLSASMAMQAQLLDAGIDSHEGGTIPPEANLVSGRRNTPPSVTWNLAWEYANSGNSVMNTNGYSYRGALNGVKCYRYQWDSDLQIYFCFSDNSATWTSPISGATCVMPARGTYTVSTTFGDMRIGAYNTAWDGNTTQSRYVEGSTSYHFTGGTWYVEEGVDGPCMWSTDCYLRNAGTNKLIIGDPAVYKNVTVQSESTTKGTVSKSMKSGYVYTTNFTDWKEGSTYTITATPKSGYRFVCWKKNGTQISTDATTDVQITGDATYTAYFESNAAPQYTITVQADNDDYCTVSGGGTYYAGTEVTISSTSKNPHLYIFDQFMLEGEDEDQGEPSFNITVTGNATYTAYYRLANAGNISATAAHGTVSGTGYYAGGTEVSLGVTPDDGYSFTQWSDGNTDNPRTVYVDGNKNYTAEFMYGVSLNLLAGCSPSSPLEYRVLLPDYEIYFRAGNDWSYGDGEEIPLSYINTSASYIKDHGTTVTIGNDVYAYTHTEGDRKILQLNFTGSNGKYYQILLRGANYATDCDQNFDQTFNNLAATSSGTGWRILSADNGVTEAAANASFGPNHWDIYLPVYIDESKCGSENNGVPSGIYPILDTDEDGTIRATISNSQARASGYWTCQNINQMHKLVTGYMDVVNRDGNTYAEINGYTSSCYPLHCVAKSSSSVGVPVTINCTAGEGGSANIVWHSANCGDVTYTAVDMPQKFFNGNSITLTASANSGYEFWRWSDEDASVVNSAYGTSRNVTVSGNLTLQAIFREEATNHTVTITAPTNGTITVSYNDGSAQSFTSGSRDIAENTVLTITAEGATGYHFDSWTNDGAANVTVNNDKTIGATFAANAYTVTFNKNGGTGDDMTAQDFTYGTAQNLTVNAYTAPENKHFMGWATTAEGDVAYADGAEVNNLTATQNGEVELFAKWAYNTYTVVFNKNNEDATGTMANQAFTYGTAQNLTTNGFTLSGHDFAGWATEENGAVVYTNGEEVNNLTSVHEGTVNLYAKWIEIFVLRDDKEAGDTYYTTTYANKKAEGKKLNVQYKRTFTKDRWCVFSVPFNYSFRPEENTTFNGLVYYLLNAEYTTDGVLTLNFMPNSTGIKANVPYIVIPKETIVNPVFNNVTLKGIDDGTQIVPNTEGTLKFINTQYRQTINRADADENKRVVYLSANHLYYPSTSSDTWMRAFSGYFYMQDCSIYHTPYRLRFLTSEGDMIEQAMDNEAEMVETRKYIENGILVIERAGMKYDAQGHIIK